MSVTGEKTSATEENKAKDDTSVEALKRDVSLYLLLLLTLIPGVRNFATQSLAGKSDAFVLVAILVTLAAIGCVSDSLTEIVSDLVTGTARGIKHRPIAWAVFRLMVGGPMLASVYWIVLSGAAPSHDWLNPKTLVFFLGVVWLAFGLWPPNWLGPSDRSKVTLKDRLWAIAAAILCFGAGFNLFSRL